MRVTNTRFTRWNRPFLSSSSLAVKLIRVNESWISVGAYKIRFSFAQILFCCF